MAERRLPMSADTDSEIDAPSIESRDSLNDNGEVTSTGAAHTTPNTTPNPVNLDQQTGGEVVAIASTSSKAVATPMSQSDTTVTDLQSDDLPNSTANIDSQPQSSLPPDQGATPIEGTGITLPEDERVASFFQEENENHSKTDTDLTWMADEIMPLEDLNSTSNTAPEHPSQDEIASAPKLTTVDSTVEEKVSISDVSLNQDPSQTQEQEKVTVGHTRELLSELQQGLQTANAPLVANEADKNDLQFSVGSTETFPPPPTQLQAPAMVDSGESDVLDMTTNGPEWPGEVSEPFWGQKEDDAGPGLPEAIGADSSSHPTESLAHESFRDAADLESSSTWEVSAPAGTALRENGPSLESLLEADSAAVTTNDTTKEVASHSESLLWDKGGDAMPWDTQVQALNKSDADNIDPQNPEQSQNGPEIAFSDTEPSDALDWANEFNVSKAQSSDQAFFAEERDLSSMSANNKGDSSEPTLPNSVPFVENDSSGTLDWADDVNAPKSQPSHQALFTEGHVPSSNGTDSDSAVAISQKPGVEDSWAEAFGDGSLDDSWNDAFGDGFDDDGLLEETGVEVGVPQQSLPQTATVFTQQQLQNAPAPTQQPPSQPAQQNAQAMRNPATPATNSPYNFPSAAGISSGPQQASTPMQFFEELPSAPIRVRKSRQQTPPASQPSAPPPSSQPIRSTSSAAQFHPPERLDPFPPQPSVPVTSTYAQTSQQQQPPRSVPTATARYSPAPNMPASSAIPSSMQPPRSASSRYAASPARSQEAATNQPPPTATKSPYAPSSVAVPPGASTSTSSRSPPSSSYAPPPSRPSAPQAPTQGVDAPNGENQKLTTSSSYLPSPSLPAGGMPSGPPPPVNRFAPRTSSPLARQDHLLHPDQSIMGVAQGQEPPASSSQERNISQVQIPSTQMFPISNSYQPLDSTKNTARSGPVVGQNTTIQDAYFTGGPSSQGPWPHSAPQHQHEDTDFVIPSNETAQDPLQRWKGAPIFHWGATGSVVTCLPVHTHRFGGGQSKPKLSPMAGTLKLQKGKDILDDYQTPHFPGPLKSKGRKKEVINWLAAVVNNIEKQVQTAPLTPVAEWTNLDEKATLWKVMKVFIEFDGTLAGSPGVEAAAREALKSHSAQAPQVNETQVTPTSSKSVNINTSAVTEIKTLLGQGNREKAVWYAVDNQLWAHAMVLAPSSGPNIWKQVVQEFVKKEVRSAELDNQSLAALYQVLAGNWDECIDELVPLSARSGFQMVSTVATPGQTRDAFEGLNKWRETLSLILSNRSPEDENAIVSLGKLLAGSGRVSAAHVCYLFARSFATFGGADDPQTAMALVGVDHGNPWSAGGADLTSIQLSEVYEFGVQLSSSTSSYHAPHLQAYKLQHALVLAESGKRTEALQYCDSIASTLKSTTKMSPYYNSTLLGQLDDLQRRLSQSPKDGSSSWISKPSTGIVSSKMSNWFNNFIAGDDDATSTGSGHQSEAENGPFARISGETPIISRSASAVDMQASYQPSVYPPPSGVPSKYAPGGYAPQTIQGDDGGSGGTFVPYTGSPELRQSSYSPRSSLDSPMQPYGSPPKQAQFARQPSNLSQQQLYSPQTLSGSTSSAGAHASGSYQPYVPAMHEEPSSGYMPSYGSIQPETPANNSGATQAGNQQKANGSTMATNNYAPMSAVYEPLVINDSQAVAPQETQSHEPPRSGSALQEADDAPSNYQQHSQTSDSFSYGGYEPQQGGYAPPQDGYAPPQDGYAPPSYQPYELDQSPTNESNNDSKRSTTAEEGDRGNSAPQSEDSKRQDKAARDKAADEAFRAAAEADAARDKEGKEKRSGSGWLSGIGGFGNFFGKKDPNAPTVHRAKLGEESSFYFDKETQKWVNRKGGSSPSPGPSTPAAPPPRASAPPSRNVSAAAGPPRTASPATGPSSSTDASLKLPSSTLLASRSGTPASAAGSISSETKTAGEQPNSGTAAPPPATSSGPPSAPPSRPATSASNTNSIEDLIGAPQARKGGTIKKAKKGQRYVDVMANQ